MNFSRIFSMVLLVVFCEATAQKSNPAKFQVVFSDKGRVEAQSLRANQYLSEASIERRKIQNIPIEYNDYPVNPEYITQLREKGYVILNKSRWFNSVSVYCDDSIAVAEIQKLPFVAEVRPVTKVLSSSREEHKLAEHQKNLTRFRSPVGKASVQQNSSSLYGVYKGQTEQIGLTTLHEMGFKGGDMTVAVLDAGFYNGDRIPFFDSLRRENRILGTRDFVQGNDSVYEDNAHGMSVLSCMAANIPGLAIGTAPHAQYWLLRTEDAGSEYIIEEDNWVAAAEFADSVGAWIINSSLGYTVYDDPQTSHAYSDLDGNTTRITRGADIAASKGILVVNSAGNSGDNSWRYIGAPADADSVLTIGAVDSLGNYASFSSQGPSADGRIKPNVSCTGQATWIVTGSGNLGRANGTSFSSPILAGAAACLWQAFPDASNMEIFKAIEQSAHQFDNPDYFVGYGIPNFTRAFGILKKARNTDANRDSLLNVYPNPAVGSLVIDFYSATEQQIQISVTKLSGKRVQDQRVKVLPFYNNPIQFDFSRRMSSGNYIITVTNAAGQVFSRRIVISN